MEKGLFLYCGKYIDLGLRFRPLGSFLILNYLLFALFSQFKKNGGFILKFCEVQKNLLIIRTMYC